MNKIETQVKRLTNLAGEMANAFNLWDERIKNKQQPIPIQDLDYWKDEICSVVSKLNSEE